MLIQMYRSVCVPILVAFYRLCKLAEARASLHSFGKIGKSVHLRSSVTVYHPETITIGDFLDVGENVVLRGAGGIAIGDRVLIAAGAVITTVGHPLELPRWGITVAKPVRIGDDVWIGANAVILPGVSIGSGSIVGAGAVVTRDVPADTVVAGVPARVIKSIPRATKPL